MAQANLRLRTSALCPDLPRLRARSQFNPHRQPSTTPIVLPLPPPSEEEPGTAGRFILRLDLIMCCDHPALYTVRTWNCLFKTALFLP
jgi:hypothetical protein